MKIDSIKNLNTLKSNSAFFRNNLPNQNNSFKTTPYSEIPFQTYQSNLVPFLGNKNLLTKEIFVREGFLKKTDDFEKFLNTIFDRLYSQENNELGKQTALKYFKQSKIALSQGFFRLGSLDKGSIGTCSTLLDVKESPKRHIMNGVGMAVNLNNLSAPLKTLQQLDWNYQECGKHSPRPAAGIALLDVTNSEIETFINYHRGKDFTDTCFSTSISVPHDFLTKVDTNQNITLTNGKTLKAKELYQKILEAMYERGNPGIIFEDTLNRANPIPSRPFQGISTCAEMGLENGEPSLFSYINLSTFLNPRTNKIDYKGMAKASQTLSHLLNNVIDINLSENLYLNDTAMLKRRFGIGVYGYADLIAKMGHEYGSPEAINVLKNCLETINYSSKQESMNLAKTKGAFPLFNQSRYNEADFLIKHDVNTDSPITTQMWETLHKQIQQTGLRNASTTSLPPTCSSARLSDTSYSIEPFLSLKDNKIFKSALKKLMLSNEQKNIVMESVNKKDSIQGLDFLSDNFKNTFKTATEIDYYKHLNTVAEAQKFVDDSISKTVNLPQDTSIEDIDKIIRYADAKKLKGITVFVNKAPNEL